ncbi:rhomboid family intramembrane serine protease [Galbibacter sp.]|uniref:rhomboid family intramembrane serine protease n=1 Tax=Galbibacter sp. TaxID=2918471 RepID=UPI002BFB07AB|nr:rhomboid family intramembrane serine protease [Galbibacter sp.]HLV62010.1 rhomboid family intramembrane serine protease [Galbibacter sp.]
MGIRDEINLKFSVLNIAEKLIIINTAVFIVNALVVFLFQLPIDFIMGWFELPKGFDDFIIQPWSLITYSFFHGSFMHLFWNMILLFFVGRFFLMVHPTKRFLSLYILGAMAGGLLFLLSYNIFPVFSGVNSSLIGASAAVMAVMIFVCTSMPYQEVKLFFILNVKLWHIGAVLVLLDLVSLPFSNSGGHLAHLGGALLGYVYAKKLQNGDDIGRGIYFIMEGVSSWFSKSKKAPMRTVYRSKKSQRRSATSDISDHQKKVDVILDKISKSGYESLSKEEKDFLFNAGKD